MAAAEIRTAIFHFNISSESSCSKIAMLQFSSGASRGAPHWVGSLKVRQRSLTLWKRGLEHLEKWNKVIAPSGAPPEELYEICATRITDWDRTKSRDLEHYLRSVHVCWLDSMSPSALLSILAGPHDTCTSSFLFPSWALCGSSWTSR